MASRITTALVAPLALGVALCAGAASAATFDFAALAATEKAARGKEVMFSEAMPGGWTVDGITVTTSANGFLDGPFRSRGFDHASSGLGACNDPSGDCNASDWDGVREAGETLSIFFSQVVAAAWTLRETTPPFQAGTGPDHTLVDGCAMVNGVERTVSGGAVQGDLGASDTWSFRTCASGGDFYVSAADASVPVSPVPVPAGAVLLGTALAGLGWRARRSA